MRYLICMMLFTIFISTANASLLAKNGKTNWTIVIASDATKSERTAAKELQKHLKLVTGAQFTIQVECCDKQVSNQIFVGQCKRSKDILKNIEWKSLGSDGIVMKTVGKSIVLAGGRPRGSLYAVYSFLEDVIGCHWWTPTESFIPKKRVLDIPNLDKVYIPKIKCREVNYRGPHSNGVFCSYLKLNGNWYSIPEEYGGHYSILGWCHTFYELIPPAKYFAQHPEWFSEINGKRVDNSAQLCLSNEEMRKELVKNALELIQTNPSAGIISISQNDANGACQCSKCKAIEEQEGAPSGPIIRFVNAVAEEIEKEYPDFLVETLAYTYSRTAPKLAKPRHNVLVRLCSIEADFAHPLNSKANASFRNDVITWSSISPNLYIWNYVTNFRDHLMPHPNIQNFGDDIRFFENHNVIGVFEQGDPANLNGDFGSLRTWVMSHLLWNPALDEKQLINEFMNGYYGKAAPYLISYLDLIHSAFLKLNKPLSCYNRDFSFLGIEEMNKATQLFAEAESVVAKNPVIIKRIQAAKLPLDHAWLIRYPILKRLAVEKQLPFSGPTDRMQACEEFILNAKKFETVNAAEGLPFDKYEDNLRSLCKAPAPPPEQFKNIPDMERADIQQNLFTYYWSGESSFIVDDPTASDGKAAKSPGGHNRWSIQWPVSPDVEGKWHCYVIARCESKATSGKGYDIGLWDNNTSQGLALVSVPIETDANQPYKTYDLGIHDMKQGMYFWFVPNGDGKAIDAFYIDRIFLVKAE